MKINKTYEVVDLWWKCKIKSILFDPLYSTNKVDYMLAKERFAKKLIEQKFEWIAEGSYKKVFSKKSIDFVVKIYNSGIIDDKKDKRFKLDKYCVDSIYFDGAILIQPKVKRNKKNKAYEFFEKKWGKHYCELHDVHQENIGWLNNKPAIFDFMTC